MREMRGCTEDGQLRTQGENVKSGARSICAGAPNSFGLVFLLLLNFRRIYDIFSISPFL